MISRVLRGSAAIVFAAAVFSSATTAGSGAEALRLAQVTTTPKGDLLNQTPAEQKDAWTVSCRKTADAKLADCQMSQHVVIKDTGKRLLSVIVERRPTETGLSLLLLMAHGVFLPAGIAVQAPGAKPLQLEYRLSDADGVYAAATLTDDLLRAMQTGDALKVSVMSANRQKIGIPVSLKGFAAAFGKLSALK